MDIAIETSKTPDETVSSSDPSQADRESPVDDNEALLSQINQMKQRRLESFMQKK